MTGLFAIENLLQIDDSIGIAYSANLDWRWNIAAVDVCYDKPRSINFLTQRSLKMRIVSLCVLFIFLSSLTLAQSEKLPDILKPDAESEAEAHRMGVSIFKLVPRNTFPNSLDPSLQYKDEGNPIGPCWQIPKDRRKSCFLQEALKGCLHGPSY